MSPLTFAMSTVTRNSASSFLDNLFWRPSYLSPTATRTTHLWVTYIIPVLKQQTRLFLRLQRCISCSDNQPLQFCLSILETFIPYSKIYRTTNYWQHAKCLLNPFIPVFFLTTTTSTKGFLSTQALLNF